FVAAGVLACRRAVASSPAERAARQSNALDSFMGRRILEHLFRAAGRAPSTAGEDARRYSAFVAAGVLACRRAVASSPAERAGRQSNALDSFMGRRILEHLFRAAGRAPSTAGE